MVYNRCSWQEIMRLAKAAKQTMIADQAAGEAEFERLLRECGQDGMIYFERGEAYESLKQFESAIQDFAKATQLFPISDWKAKAKAGLDRCREGAKNRGPSAQSLEARLRQISRMNDKLVQQAMEALRQIDTSPCDAVVALRRCLEHFIYHVEGQSTNGDDRDLYVIIQRMKERYPTTLINYMHTVRSMGNVGAHYGGRNLVTPTDAVASAHAMACILEWLDAWASPPEKQRQ